MNRSFPHPPAAGWRARPAYQRAARAGLLLGLGLILGLLAAGAPRSVQAQAGPKAHTGSPTAAPAFSPPGPPGTNVPPLRAALALRPADVITNGWTNLFPHLAEVSAVASTEAWAVGDYGRLLHFAGGTWTALDPPTLRGLPLSDIKMLSATDGWIAGGPQAFQYDGAAWTSRSTGLSPDLTVSRLAPLTDNNVWAIGVLNTHSSISPPLVPAVLHWDGARWTPVVVTGVYPGTYLNDIVLTGPTDGWAAGWEDVVGNGPLLLHYDGSRWTRVIPPPTGGELGLFNRLSATGPGDVWMTGIDNTYAGRIYHYSGGAWTSSATPGDSQPIGIFMLGPNDGWATSAINNAILHWDGTAWRVEAPLGRNLVGLSGVAGQVWAVGYADSVWSRGADSVWTRQRGGPTTQTLSGVSALSPDDAWAVGAPGTVVHYNAGTVQLVTTPFTLTLTAVQMLSPTEGYAVGGDDQAWPYRGVIARWDGAQWTQVAAPPAKMNGLFMLGSGDGWAVGQNGEIWRDTAGVWARVSNTPFGGNLMGVALDSPTHGWAVGGYSSATLLEWNGVNWLDRGYLLPATTPQLAAIALAPGGDEGWAVANPGTDTTLTNAIVHLQHGVWTRAESSAKSLSSVAIEANGEAWAVGVSGAYHEVGGVWLAADYPSNYGLTSLALLPGQGGWAVGYNGTILRYNPLAPGQRFYDVPPGHPFYIYINYLAARNIVSGYSDNTFRAGGALTRGQLTKMVAAGLGWALVSPAGATFADVPPSHPFYAYIETAAAHGAISGYACGGPGEPCDAQTRPYFRPAAAITRAQIAKIVVLAREWGPLTPAQPTFADVPASHPFYGFIERAVQQGIVSGYGCSAPGEPCPGVYFRPAAGATRGQLSKILYLALNPGP